MRQDGSGDICLDGDGVHELDDMEAFLNGCENDGEGGWDDNDYDDEGNYDDMGDEMISGGQEIKTALVVFTEMQESICNLATTTLRHCGCARPWMRSGKYFLRCGHAGMVTSMVQTMTNNVPLPWRPVRMQYGTSTNEQSIP